RPNLLSRCSRTASPKPVTDNESPIMSTFGGGGGDAFLNLSAQTKEPMTSRSASENETERIIGDQSLLPCLLGVSGFILDANIGFQIDPAGIVFGFCRTPDRALQRAQLKLVGPADVKFP